MPERSSKQLILGNESGEGADIVQAEKLASEIYEKWKFPESKPSKPFLLLIGGFQGSGKTSVIEEIKDDFGLIVISPDEIRYLMFSKEIPFSEDFVTLVNATVKILLKKALATGYSVVLDRNMTEQRMELIKTVLLEENRDYLIISVLLTAPQEELERRVNDRSEYEGKYKGTVDELRASCAKYGQPDESIYDLVIDTSIISVESAGGIIATELAERLTV